MYHVGLDVHLRLFVLCILDNNGKQVKRKTIRGGFEDLMVFLKGLDKPFRICYEASCGYGHLFELLTGVARNVLVAHPGRLRLIFRSKKKNDRVDAKKLATLLLLDQVPAIHVPGVDVRSWRNFIEFRYRRVMARTRTKNALRSLLRGHGIIAVGGHRLWTRKGLAWLEAVELPTPAAMLQRDLLLEDLMRLNQQIRRVETELKRIARDHPGVKLLMTIPGIGIRTAEAVVAYIDDSKRFTRNKQIGSYFGLVPCQDQSASCNRFGHITQEGPSTARMLLTEATWQSIRRSPQVRAYFERIKRNDAQRRKIALVATAHYLLRVMLSMLQTGEVCRFEVRKAA